MLIFSTDTNCDSQSFTATLFCDPSMSACGSQAFMKLLCFDPSMSVVRRRRRRRAHVDQKGENSLDFEFQCEYNL